MNRIRPISELQAPRPVQFSQIGFLGLVEHPAGGFDAAYREFTPGRSDTETTVRHQRYDAEFDPVGESRLLKTRAEDPRIFWFNNRAVVLTHIWQPEQEDWLQVLIDLKTGEEQTIRHDLRFAGKNWMPVMGTEPDLLMIRSLDPLCVVRIKRNESNEARVETIIDEPPDNIGEYRGGGAAIKADGLILGIGHRTQTDPLRHTPFAFAIDLKAHSVAFSDLQPDGFGADPVIDPTSRLKDGRIICSCSRQSWWDEQKISHRLCAVSSD